MGIFSKSLICAALFFSASILILGIINFSILVDWIGALLAFSAAAGLSAYYIFEDHDKKRMAASRAESHENC